MAADFSRVRLDPLLDFAGVELKQGGVLLDADANELVAIVDRRLRALASDTLGRATVAATTPDAFKVSLAGGTLQLGTGRLYVDGLLAENHGAASGAAAKRAFDSLMAEPVFTDPVSYSAQPYLPAPPALPTAGSHLVYLDVWNRELTHLERPQLVESAVAVETSSRLQTVWQVRVLDIDAASATCATPDAGLPGWAAVIAPSTGVLTTGTFEVPPSSDPCELPPSGGYRGLENQLYRVEVQDPGQPGAGATFKWSRENASVGSRVQSMVSGSVLELQTLGRDEVLRLNTGDWVEIIDDVRELAQAAGEMRRITVDEVTRRISFAPALPAAMLPGAFPDSALAAARNLRVRRWDQKGLVFRTNPGGNPVQVQDLDAAGSGGVINVPAPGTTLLLEHGISVSFDSTGASGLKAGDYWVFAARTADASVELLERAPPRGVHHHYARLGIWDVAAASVSDCRNPWPPKPGGGADCACTECVTPESHASGQLTIQAAVDKLRDSGGSVCLHAGAYVLQEPVRIAGARSLRITGQGPATMIAARGGAFVIERSSAIALDQMAVFSVGGSGSCVSVRSAFGLALRKLTLAVVGSKAAQAAIALAGVVIDTSIDNNLLLAPDGVRALEGPDAQGPGMLLSAVLRIDDNLFLCRDSAVKLDGPVGHVFQTRVSGNQVLGTHEVGISALGLAFPGASLEIKDNNLATHGMGIRCGVDGAWIVDNKLRATRDGDNQLRGAGIALLTGLDRNGSNQAQVLANQVDGFTDAGITIAAPVQDLIVKQNLIEGCGNGIVMADSASALSVSIENNHLHNIGLGPNAGTPDPGSTVGIGIIRTEAATVAGNSLRKVGLAAEENFSLVAGVIMLAVQRPRIGGNEIMEVGPLKDTQAVLAGINIRAPYAQAEVHHNHVERDAEFNGNPSKSPWFALYIDQIQPGLEQLLSRLGRYAALRVDPRKTLVLAGNRVFVDTVKGDPGIDPATGEPGAFPGASASVLGNVLIARGSVSAVEIAASGEVLFNDNRCELRGSPRRSAVVRLNTPVAVINANRVRGGEASIALPRQSLVAAIGNITTSPIQATLRPEMVPLNLIG